jgi:hypothetical protein
VSSDPWLFPARFVDKTPDLSFGRNQGIIGISGEFLVSTLWDNLMRPEWREWASKQPEPRSKEDDAQTTPDVWFLDRPL